MNFSKKEQVIYEARILRTMKNAFLRLKQDILNWYKGILAAIAYCIVMHILFGKVCPMVLVTGFPCPACGTTRAGLALLTLHWDEAWQLNGVIFLIAAFVMYFFFCRYILQCKCYGCFFIIIAIIVCYLMLYFYRMIYIFPSEPPMEYYTNNLLSYLKN